MLSRYQTCRASVVAALVLGPLGPGASAAEVRLTSVQFPEKREVAVPFTAVGGAPLATLDARVTYRDGQARIAMSYQSMKPAILFGGDITCYVLWAVSRGGSAENLGELQIADGKGTANYSTGKKDFAMLVTAEPYYLVGSPSDLIVFTSGASSDKQAPSADFTFADLGPAAQHAMDSIASIAWDSKTPLELLQARKALEIADRYEAQSYAEQLYGDARAALDQANELEQKNKRGRPLTDAAVRAVALANEAINLSVRRKEALELEDRITRRRAEMEEMEQRARAAEQSASEALREVEESRGEVALLAREAEQLVASKSELERTTERLEVEKESLALERARLADRLETALSSVAETQDSVRGFVVSLPDILFDLNQATIKSETRIVLAKLAGILLIVPDQNVAIEGHTDSTGSAEYNLKLSLERAESVLAFLAEQGIAAERLQAAGFGMDRPVAENDTPEDRARNRRVELVIGAGGQ